MGLRNIAPQHAPDTKARLALELLLQTGQARADVVRMVR